MLKYAIRLASRGGSDARLSILIFHRVLPEPDPLFPGEVCRNTFDQLIGWVSRWFRVLPLADAVRHLAQGTLPRGAASITFDDGYADNLLHAQPILEKHGACATLFVAAGFLDGGIMWNDRVIESVRRTSAEALSFPQFGLASLPLGGAAQRRAAIEALIGHIKYLPVGARDEAVAQVVAQCAASLPGDLMLTSAQLKALHQRGMGIGAHTVNHPILARSSAAEARREVTDGREQLESIIGERVGLFAYPNGRPGSDYLPEHAELVASLGFDAAVSTTWGVASRRHSRFELPRFTPWDRSRARFGARMLANLARG